MPNNSTSKIGFASRYYEPLRYLKAQLDSTKAFKLIHNSDKDTYSLPYLYTNYKDELNPTLISTRIIKSIKQYLEDNLFNTEEKKLLLIKLDSFQDLRSILENIKTVY